MSSRVAPAATRVVASLARWHSAGSCSRSSWGWSAPKLIKSFGEWDHGYQWEADLMLWIHRPLPGWLDLVVLATPWFGTNLTLIPVILALSWWLWRKWGGPTSRRS